MVHSSVQIGPNTHVTLSYVAYDEDGDVVDEAVQSEPLQYIHGFGQMVPGLEKALEGMNAGQQREISLKAADAYGDHDPEGIFEVDRGDFPEPETVSVDDEFVAEGPDGTHLVMRVIDVVESGFIVDTNHPLAGLNLRYEVKVLAVRDATDEELAEAEAELDDDACGCGEDHDHGHDHAHDDDVDELIQIRMPTKGDDRPS